MEMQAGGPSYAVELGRRDGKISTLASVQHRLPHPDFTLDQLNTMFGSNGLNQTDMIALSGTCLKLFHILVLIDRNITWLAMCLVYHLHQILHIKTSR